MRLGTLAAKGRGNTLKWEVVLNENAALVWAVTNPPRIRRAEKRKYRIIQKKMTIKVAIIPDFHALPGRV